MPFLCNEGLIEKAKGIFNHEKFIKGLVKTSKNITKMFKNSFLE